MTRMMSKHALHWSFTVIIMAFVAVGCGPSEQQLKIQDLSAENELLKADLLDRDRQINDAVVRENDARETIDELNREMAFLRSERDRLKNAPPPTATPVRTEIDGWVSTPDFDMISISGSVLFASGKAKVTKTGRAKLASVAGDIKSRYPDRDIYVFGHTDAQPIRKSSWKDNWELGANRALSVVRSLANLGIPQGQLIAASCGEHRPQIPGASKQNQARNRRVEVYAVRGSVGLTERTASSGY